LRIADEAIISMNEAQEIVLFNEGAEDIFGYRSQEVLGKPLDILLPRRFVEAHSVHIQKFTASPAISRMMNERGVIYGLRRNGTEFPAEASISKLESGDEKLFTVILRDITERKRSEQELKNAFSEIEKLKDRLQEENIYLRKEIMQDHNLDEIIGKTDAIKKVLLTAVQVADTDTTVLILGETGTGKELFAHAIHKVSKRSGRPMVKVNCATLPATLIESELFGHEKGAFTGAATARKGRFELANGGTIFLDEIAELPLELQAKLLQVLQESKFQRLGSSLTIHVDVRVIAATNRDLEEEIRKGRFREDLYYRLNVFPILIPPLCERKEDITLLVESFIDSIGKRLGKKIETIPRESFELLKEYPWPGNIRELKNIIERAVIITQGSKLQLPESLKMPRTQEEPAEGLKSPQDTGLNVLREGTLEEIERDYIVQVMEKTYWRIEGPYGAAEILGLNPSTLRSRTRKLGIKRPRVHN
jgi:PAS domain S-box-containing protein